MGATEIEHTDAAYHQLIFGLPDEIVVGHVLPRLPWYSRPACRAISKAWKARLDSKNPELEHKTRQLQTPLLRGLFLICTYDKQIFIRENDLQGGSQMSHGYQNQKHWRKLPPLHGAIVELPRITAMVASSGVVYVWSERGDWNFVLKLDMACGDWTWRRFCIPHNLGSDVVIFNGCMYAPLKEGSSEKNVVLMYDMMTDECQQIDTWYQSDLRVLSNGSHPNEHAEEMYGLVEDETISDEKLEVLKFDIRSDSWRKWEELPIPECRWSHLPEVQILNGQCFEPAAESGTNVVWVDHEGEVISWFNRSLGMNWAEFNYNPVVEGKGLEYIEFIHGSLYGIFIEDVEEGGGGEEQGGNDDGEGPGLLKRFIMRGRLRVADESVAWEEVHEIGGFREAIMHPIDCYTLMA